MKHARITLRFPDRFRHPMQVFLLTSPQMYHEELWAWNHLGDSLTALFYVEGDIETYRDAIEDVDTIQRYDLTPVGDDAFYTYVEEIPREGEVLWMAAFARPSLIVVPPVVYRDTGDTEFTVVGESADLQGLVEDLPNDIDIDIDRIGEYDTQHTARPMPDLTHRQREAVSVALDAGYYDRPRTASLDDVASALDCASGTASELLRRAERTVLSTFVADRADPPT